MTINEHILKIRILDT